MQVVLVRVGIDLGKDTGRLLSPLFRDGTFEYIPIFDRKDVDSCTYGSVRDRHGQPLSEYFPEERRSEVRSQPMHLDPEFRTFTYGDPTRTKSRLRNLSARDLLVFYAGLRPYDYAGESAMYIIGYFRVEVAGLASGMDEKTLLALFGTNFHVRNSSILAEQRDRLVLVRGSAKSRLLTHAVCISERGVDGAGKPLHVLSRPMRGVFGDLGGANSIQRSNPRWISPSHVDLAAEFVDSLG